MVRRQDPRGDPEDGAGQGRAVRPDLLARRTKARSQFPRLLGIRTSDGRNPHALADLRFPIRAEHLREHRHAPIEGIAGSREARSTSWTSAGSASVCPSSKGTGAKAIGSLHEFGRYVNELQYKARHTEGHTAAHAMLTEWLKDIAYEAHLLDNEENEKVAQARWGNVLDFVEWIAKRCGGQASEEDGVSFIEPAEGLLACGYEGVGRLAPVEEIVAAAQQAFVRR